MMVTIQYLAQMRHAAGTTSEQVETAEGSAARHLVETLATVRGDPLRAALLTPEGTLRPSVLLFVADRQVGADDVALHDGDEIVVLSPIAGG
jgi:molybdopterin converting factor small subunit